MALPTTPKTPTSTASSAMRRWSESSSPLARQRTAAGWKASREAAGDQEADRRTVQALTFPSSMKKTQLVGWTVNSTGAPSRNGSQKHATQICSLLRKLTCPRTLWSQRRPGCDRKDGGRALRLRSFGPPSMASGSPPSRRRAAREARGSRLQRRCGMVWRRRTVVLAAGASSCARSVCLRSTTAALCQAGH